VQPREVAFWLVKPFDRRTGMCAIRPADTDHPRYRSLLCLQGAQRAALCLARRWGWRAALCLARRWG
jgi:hypothetical protein